ncbi:hypothetical protein MN608_11070 [Microdochium nivale]|nr:hypothetical protein MN608_11070 [Microdochium nivale]
MSASQPTHPHCVPPQVTNYTIEAYENLLQQLDTGDEYGRVKIHDDMLITIYPEFQQTTAGAGPAINENHEAGSAGAGIGAASSLRIPSITLIKPDGSTGFIIPSPSDRVSALIRMIRTAIDGHRPKAVIRYLKQWLKNSDVAYKDKQAAANKNKDTSVLSLMCCCGLPLGRESARSRRSRHIEDQPAPASPFSGSRHSRCAESQSVLGRPFFDLPTESSLFDEFMAVTEWPRRHYTVGRTDAVHVS